MKFALMYICPEALQDFSQYGFPPSSFTVHQVGSDPANDTILAFVESDLLPKVGFNGFVSGVVSRDDDSSRTLSWREKPTTQADYDAALTKIFLYKKFAR